MIFTRVRDNVHATFSIYIIPILDRMVILPSSLCLPPWEGFWVFFSGNLINPWPGASSPLAEKENRLSAGRQLSGPRRAVTFLLKKGWLKLFLFGVDFPKIILFEIIYSSLMFQTPDGLLRLELWWQRWRSSRGCKCQLLRKWQHLEQYAVHGTLSSMASLSLGHKTTHDAFLPQHWGLLLLTKTLWEKMKPFILTSCWCLFSFH